MTKEEFLKKNGYKRYTNLPLRYRGGKSSLVGKIIEQFPDNFDRLISPFFGGGSVEIATAKELNKEVIGFDIFDILINYWDCQINNIEDMMQYMPLNMSEDVFNLSLDKLIKHRDNISIIDNKYELAALFWLNHNLSFGPDSFSKYPSKERFEFKRFSSLKEKVKNFNVNNISVFNSSFEEVISKYNNDFIYLDPPYFVDKNTTYCALYPNVHSPYYHNNFKHEKLCELLKQHKGKFLLSYNNCEYIKELYKEFNIIEIPVKYGLNNISGKSKKITEILIKNY